MPPAQIPLLADVRRDRGPSITARPTADEKRRFADLAGSRGISESTLALICIRALLDDDQTPSVRNTHRDEPAAATDRITIRLRPGDHQVIACRAAQRDMKASSYLAALIRAHVVTNPPLAATELHALKQSIVVLSGLGRLLARTVHSTSLDSPEHGTLRQQLVETRAAIAMLEERTHDLARAALISWESCSA
jgi:hypothetical protein